MESLFSKIDSLIQRAGFAVICVSAEPGKPPFSYTVGLTETFECAELMIFGVGQEAAMPAIHTIVDRIRGGKRFTDGDMLEQVFNFPCSVKAVSSEAALEYALNVAARYEGNIQGPTFLQIVYPDQAGAFPWEISYSESMRPIQLELWRSLH